MFELLDAGRHRGLNNIGALGAPSEAHLLGDPEEVLNLEDLPPAIIVNGDRNYRI